MEDGRKLVALNAMDEQPGRRVVVCKAKTFDELRRDQQNLLSGMSLQLSINDWSPDLRNSFGVHPVAWAKSSAAALNLDPMDISGLSNGASHLLVASDSSWMLQHRARCNAGYEFAKSSDANAPRD
jgi:hypothetical protein